MKNFPIIVMCDWVSLIFIEAATREEALIKAATDWVNTMDGEIRLDPAGVQGQGTPNATLVTQQPKLVMNPKFSKENPWKHGCQEPIQIADGWETESTFISPIYEPIPQPHRTNTCDTAASS